MFSLRYALASIVRRPGRSMFLIGLAALMLAALLTVTGLLSAVADGSAQALVPLREAGVDLVVTAGVAGEAIAAEGAVKLDAAGLVPGERFVRDEFLVEAYWPLSQQTVEILSSDPGIAGVSKAVLIGCSRTTGTAPDTIVIPTLVVDPLTDAEKAAIERSLAADASYRAAEAELYALREKERAGEAVDRARMTTLAQKLVDIEFGYYPKRFKGVDAQTVAPDPVEAVSTSFLVAGVETSGTTGLLGPDDLVAGRGFDDGVGRMVVLEVGFAKLEGVTVGDVFVLRGQEHLVVGLARPPAGLTSAQVFLPIDAARELARVDGFNVAVVKTTGPGAVSSLKDRLAEADPQVRAMEPSDVSARLTSGLVEAESLLKTYGSAVRPIVVFAAVGVAFLASVNAFSGRDKELRSLAAVGWTRTRILVTAGLEAAGLAVASVAFGVLLARFAAGAIAGSSWTLHVEVASLAQGITGSHTDAVADVGLTPIVTVGWTTIASAAVGASVVAGAIGGMLRAARRFVG